jgi:putative hydrolase of the HAD superfamily
MNAIVFDLDGTLLEFSREYDELLAETFRAVEGESRDEWVEAYSEAFFERFSACEPEPIHQAFATVSANPDALREGLHEREIEAAEPPECTRTALEQLAGEYRIGVLTNGIREWQLGKLRGNGLAGYVDAVVASYEAGAHKPDSDPFELLESRLPADAYAMVGDADADVEGATRVGWDCVRYDGQGFDTVPAAVGWE